MAVACYDLAAGMATKRILQQSVFAWVRLQSLEISQLLELLRNTSS